MEPLAVVLAAILALNLAYGLFIGLLEMRRHRKARREIGTLEAMWRLDPRSPLRSERRAVRSFRVAGVLAVSLMVLSGIAIATPGGLGRVSTVTEAIGDLFAAPDGQVAEAPEHGDGSTPIEGTSGGRADPTAGDGDGGAVNHDVAPGRESDPSSVDDPVLSDVTQTDTAPEARNPDPEQPPVDGDPPTPPAESPAPEPEPVITLLADPLSDTSVMLAWDALPAATGYRLERTGGSSDGWSVEVPAGTTSMTDGGLAPETEYTYRITATLDDGSSIVDDATVTTLASSVP
jgi:hypothetical protein